MDTDNSGEVDIEEFVAWTLNDREMARKLASATDLAHGKLASLLSSLSSLLADVLRSTCSVSLGSFPSRFVPLRSVQLLIWTAQRGAKRTACTSTGGLT